MSQPPGYTPTTDFSNEETASVAGRSTVRTSALDAEFSNIELTLDALLINLALVQRDDGALVDGVVELHSLATETLALIVSGSWVIRGSWVTGTAYAVGDIVQNGQLLYLCFEAHTSGAFATDLAALKWGQLTINPTASSVSFTPTSTIAASTVQTAIEELDLDLRPTVAILEKQMFSGT